MQFDVVVVGGGPAGSLTAYHLAKSSVRVAILDAAHFPRDKTCGGGLQHRAALRIPFDWRPALRGELDGVCFSLRCGRRFTKRHGAPLVYSMLRREFDAMLLEHARAAGAEVIEGCTARGVVAGNGSGRAAVETDLGAFEGRWIVGADGANSVVRQFVSKRSDYFWNVAISCEVPEERLRMGALDGHTARIDWGVMPGYGWMFPKRGFVNIGVGGPRQVARNLRPYLARFIQTDGVLKNGAVDELPFRGHQLPTLLAGTRLSRENVLLVGDAGGLVDPLTGDGISFGLHSAEIAAETIVDLLRHDGRDATVYDRRIMDEVGAELLWSQRLATLLVAFPSLIHGSIERLSGVWRTYCKVMRGEETALVLRRKAVPIAGLFRWLEPLAARRERRLLG